MLKCNLRVLRAIHNVTIKSLSEELNIRVGTLSKLDRDKAPGIPIEILDKLCTKFNCQLDDLYHHIPDDNKFLPKRTNRKRVKEE